ncbi:MAG: sigma-70 family RNA polymerase sigma factor [Cyanobacteria bacterium J06648_11]
MDRESQARRESLVRDYHAFLRRSIVGRVGVRGLRGMSVSDICDDVWLQIFETYSDVADWSPTRIRALLAKCAKRRIIDLFRKKAMEQDVSGCESHDHRSPNPERRAHRSEVVQVLLVCLSRLPVIYRNVIELRVIQDLSFLDIGRELGVAESTARERYRKGRRKLQRHLNELGVSPSQISTHLG